MVPNENDVATFNPRKDFTDIFIKLVGENTTQQEIADKVGTSRQNVGKWLSGATVPDIAALSRIAKAYNVSTDYLLGLTPHKTPSTKLKAVCKYTGLSEKAIENILKITLSPDTLSSKTLNAILSNDTFLIFIYNFRYWFNELSLFCEAVEALKEKLREYEEEPPKDIIKFATETVLKTQEHQDDPEYIRSCVWSEADYVVNFCNDLDYKEYLLQNSLKRLLESLKKDGENNAHHNPTQE